MAKNRYLKQHRAFCEHLDRERGTMPPALLDAAEDFRNALWWAAHNPEPPPCFTDKLAALMRVQAQSAAHKSSEHPHCFHWGLVPRRK